MSEIHQNPSSTALVDKISYEDFLKRYDGVHAEWVDGEVILPVGASKQHQKIGKFLLKVVDDYVEFKELGEAMQPPFQMKLPSKPSGREPDLLFVKKENLYRLRDTFLDGAADLAVEIVSPESDERDRTTKFGEYQTDGVREYWLIDPDQRQATFYQLDENGQFQTVDPDSEGKYHSRELANFWLQVDWLWRETLPSVQKVLLKIGGSAYQDYLNRLNLEEEI